MCDIYHDVWLCMWLCVWLIVWLCMWLCVSYRDGGGSISNSFVLNSCDIHEHFGGGVLHRHALQDGGAVVGDGDRHVVAVGHLCIIYIKVCVSIYT